MPGRILCLQEKVPAGKSPRMQKSEEAKVSGGKSPRKEKAQEAKGTGGKSPKRQMYWEAKVPGGKENWEAKVSCSQRRQNGLGGKSLLDA